MYSGRPIALIQDSAHGLKTMRNNLGSGTKTLVLGKHCAMHKHVREVADSPDSPLYMRDVEKPDKQDDRAATRVFSAETLAWFIKNRPECIGTIIYLFVFGELIDAYQHRSLPHIDRLLMILRAAYFVQIWERFLLDAGYSIKRHCISREALDIFSFLIHGYLELLFIYRDYFNGLSIPFLPWLHSSEACEHVFGECRKLVKDFDFAAFCHLMPKIHWMLRFAMKAGAISIKEAKARASGYAHKWFDINGVSLKNLASFPSDDEIATVAKRAFEEAEDLWRQLGVEVFYLRSPTAASGQRTDDSEGNNDEPEESDVDTPTLEVSRPAASPGIALAETACTSLEDLIWKEEDEYRNGPSRLFSVDKTMLHISCAKLFLDLNTSLRM